jgi:hypothetical protein
MQRLSFYPFSFPSDIWGNATAFLLPFFLAFCHLGQCNGFPFTLFPFLLPFGVMQWLSFYTFSFPSAIWGNATAFLLPFFLSFCHLGQCNGFPFTLGAMDTLDIFE